MKNTEGKRIVYISLVVFFMSLYVFDMKGQAASHKEYRSSESKTEYFSGKISAGKWAFSGKTESDSIQGKIRFTKLKKKKGNFYSSSEKTKSFSITNGQYQCEYNPEKMFGKRDSGLYQIQVYIPDGRCQILYIKNTKGIPSFWNSGYEKTDKQALRFIKKCSRSETLKSVQKNEFVNSPSDMSMTKTQYQELKNLSAKICEGAKNDYEKAYRIYCYVVDNTYYNETVKSTIRNGNNNPYYVYKKQIAVCEGYVRLLTELLSIQGIPSVHISGYADGGFALSGKTDMHAWVAIYADGRWFYADPTWDSGNLYRGKKKGKKKYESMNVWFDVAPEAFSMTHCALNMEVGGRKRDIPISFCEGRICAFSYEGKKKTVSYPAVYRGLSITAVDSTRIESDYNSHIKTVKIPAGYKVIGSYAFQYLVQMKKLVLPSTVKRIYPGMCFGSGEKTTVYAAKNSYAWNQSKKMGIRVKQK